MKPTMMTYIHQQHEVLCNLLARYPQDLPTFGTAKSVLVLATGSSINAALSAKYYLERLTGVRISVQEPFHFHHYEQWDPATDLVIAISQSGESTSTLAAIAALKQQHGVATWGITGRLSSPLALAVDHAVEIKSGEERVGYVTKGYLATIMTLMLIGLYSAHQSGRLNAQQEQQQLASLQRGAAAIPNIIERTEAFWQRWQADLTAAPRFISIGFGPAIGVLKEMETKFSETVRVPSQGIELEAFMHGPYFEINPQHRLFFIDVDAPVRERLRLLRDYEQRVTPHVWSLCLGESDDQRTLALGVEVSEWMAPLLLVIPFQILAHHIAEAKGNNLPQRIFTDFGVSMKSKTKPGDYD
ncbi:SIS domain-containing protein [Pantoea agglomerans]